MKKYNKKDFLSFASGFDYSDDLGKEMKTWDIKKFQEFYGFTYRDDETGQDK